MSAYQPSYIAILIIMPLSATVCSSPASDGACPQSAGGEPGKYILTGFSPVSELWAFSWYPVRYLDFQLVPCALPGLSVGTQCGIRTSAGTLCGTLNFG